jgi:long-chain acyl-CoA synthetase
MESLPAMLRQAAETFADRPAIWLRGAEHPLEPFTYEQLRDTVDHLAAGLVAAGVAPGDCVVLLSENRTEWVQADFAIQSAGAVTVPLYPSLPAEQVEPLVARVRARFAIVEDAKQLAKLAAARERLPHLERVWVYEPGKAALDPEWARPWSALAEAGLAGGAELLATVGQRVAALGPDDLATIIFTSGTTGVPKGAMLTHGNFLANIERCAERILIRPDDSLLTVLPLSHVFQRMVLFLGLHQGGSTLINENLRQLLPDLLRLRPTVLIVVPRMLEMIRDRVLQGIKAKQGLALTIANWAMSVGAQLAAGYEADRAPGAWLRLQQRFADQRVFSAIREQLGLDRLRYIVSGGAALPPAVGRWYWGLGLKVVQGYGLTETSPVVSCNPSEGTTRFATIGPPLRGIEVVLAPDGELLTRGPCVMRGYFEMPAETAEAIDADGWFHTGDLAAWTSEGHLTITDRKKNIMVLANGKNVAPAPIETKLAESPLVARILLVGDNQNVVTALIVPDYDALYTALERAGSAPARDGENAWVGDEAASRLVRAELDRLSTGLAPFEQVRRFRLLPRDFSLEREELTPTLKLRRKPILEHYQDLVQAMAE